MTDLLAFVSRFSIEGKPLTAIPFGEGHINKTLLVTTDAGKKYVFQSINPFVFPDTKGVMSNILQVTTYLKDLLLREGGDPDRQTLTVIPAKSGETYLYDEENIPYRVYTCVEDVFCYQVVDSPEHFYFSALAFADFTRMLADFPAEKLVETIPDFHNTKARFGQLRDAVRRNASGRAAECEKELAFAFEREAFCGRIVDAIADGRIPLRVTHNDTKLNNVLIDKATGKAICVCDLDTVMPGSVLYDFGDAIRFGTNTAAEDERDLDKVHFDLTLFEAYVRGTLEVLGGTMNETEISMLPDAAIIITVECGTRFLADYINGDVYFAISREGHNLDRAHTQFRLAAEMEKHYDEMRAIVERCR